MSNGPALVLSSDEIEALRRDIIADARARRADAAWDKVQPLRAAQRHQTEAAMALLFVVHERCLASEAALSVLSEVAKSHDQDIHILSALSECLESARDIDDLNAPPPDDPVFGAVVEKLAAFAASYEGQPEQEQILFGLASAARVLAREHDAIAETSYRKLTEIDPRRAAYHYNLGLFQKTRGRFAEGVTSNQVAARLADEVDESHQWNLGICATGAGAAAVALDVWKRMGHEIDMGRFGLPEGSFPTAR